MHKNDTPTARNLHPSKLQRFNLLKGLLAIFILFTASGCSIAYRVLLGVDSTPSWKSSEQVQRDFKRQKLPAAQSYVLDTASFYKATIAFYRTGYGSLPKTATDSLQQKRLRKGLNDDLQPVQIRFYDAKGTPLFKLVNCYLDPPIPMRWNVAGSFDQFPPANDIAQLNDFLLPMDFFLPHLLPLSPASGSLQTLPKADYYAILMWNDFMIRPSRKLLKSMRNYQKQYPDKNIHFLYVNNHNAELWPMLDAASQAKIKKLPQ
ncbi:MAG: hypothetical protein Q8J69_00835 [Sphingobacteriaceae bacterium]|nr:hypothetical protein [Sphingobacteriaceae bacterium]